MRQVTKVKNWLRILLQEKWLQNIYYQDCFQLLKFQNMKIKTQLHDSSNYEYVFWTLFILLNHFLAFPYNLYWMNTTSPPLLSLPYSKIPHLKTTNPCNLKNHSLPLQNLDIQCQPLNYISLGQFLTDYINRMITKTNSSHT